MKLVYVAGPFRGPSAWAIEENIRAAEQLALEAWKVVAAVGGAVICPHTNTRHYTGALPDEVFLKGDLEILKRCDVVLMTPNWSASAGAKEERWFAKERGIQVVYTIGELGLWLEGKLPPGW